MLEIKTTGTDGREKDCHIAFSHIVAVGEGVGHTIILTSCCVEYRTKESVADVLSRLPYEL